MAELAAPHGRQTEEERLLNEGGLIGFMGRQNVPVKYKCWFCGREYDTEEKANHCHEAGSYPVYRDGTKRRRNPFGN